MIIHDQIALKLPDTRHRISELINTKGDCHIADITVQHLLGGMRDLNLLVSDISYADAQNGLYLRGCSIPEVLAKLPRSKKTNMPYIGGLYYLLMVGTLPTRSQALAVERDWSLRASKIPKYIFNMLSIMPRETHPMTLLSQAVLALQNGSSFDKRYRLEINKRSSWESALDDSLDLTAKLPVIAAYVYRLKYFNDSQVPKYDPQIDYAQNLAEMMQVSDKEAYADLIRFYFILHSDHGSGNVSAHTMHLVGSVLSSPFYAFSASLNALAGPLHGLASQESINWLLKILTIFGGIPTVSELKAYVSREISSGKIIPGYSHALLKVIDPRFVMLLNYANDHFPQDELVRLSNLIFTIITSELASKATNPHPNLDAISGVLQYHYGVTQSDFYPVIFGLSRSLGLTANYVWSRALNFPIERPNSLTIKMLEDIVKNDNS